MWAAVLMLGSLYKSVFALSSDETENLLAVGTTPDGAMSPVAVNVAGAVSPANLFDFCLYRDSVPRWAAVGCGEKGCGCWAGAAENVEKLLYPSKYDGTSGYGPGVLVPVDCSWLTVTGRRFCSPDGTAKECEPFQDCVYLGTLGCKHPESPIWIPSRAYVPSLAEDCGLGSMDP